VRVDLTPVALLHQLVQTPKDLLLIWDVEEEDPHDVVQTLDVADFIVVAGVSLQDVVEFIVSALEVLSPETEVRHGPINVLHDLPFGLFVMEFKQFLVQVVRVNGHRLLYFQQLHPQRASHAV